jgi:hypothetical protein
MTSIYKINKGINKPIEFKGLKAQYIWWLGGGFLIMLAFFALLYFIGVNTYVCVAIVLALGTVMIMVIYRVSDTYGEHGLLKKLARHNMPDQIICRSRKTFGKLLKSDRRSLTF